MGRFFPRWSYAVLVLSAVIALSPQAQAKGPSSASTTHADGTTETIELRPDGTKTRTVTDADGHVVSSEPITPEPVTKVPPRPKGTSASTTDANGNTVTVTKNPDGTTTRTVTAPDGTVLDSGPVTAPPPTKVPPREHGTSGSTTDANGNTVIIKKNPDGTTTRTVTAPDGTVLENGPVTAPPPTTAPPREHGTSGSTTDADGNIVTIKKNPDGTTTRTVTRPDGTVMESGPVTAPPPTKVPPREHGTSASTTDANGNTVTIKTNSDGTKVRTVTSPDGTVISSGPVTSPPPTTAPPRTGGTSASTTDANGNTVTIKTNPDGSKTRTVTDPSGHVISSGPITPPPPTKPTKRKGGTSASTTDADGNTITVQTQPDGTRVRTVTSPDGKVLKTEPLNPPPAGAQLLYDTVTKDNCTVNTAMVLRMEDGKTLLDVSMLGTGKGANFRSWEPERMSLLFGQHKLKPVTTTPYFVEKESAAAGLAPILFAAIAVEDAADARKAESSKGTPCPLTGKTEGEQKRKRGKLGRAIDEVGMVAGLSLLASQAKGQIQGMRATFDVTGHEHELRGAKVAARIINANQERINLSNEPNEVDVNVPVNFTVQEGASAAGH